MVDTRIELFPDEVWSDYLAVVSGRADWAEVLERWDVSLVALAAGNEELIPFISADPSWGLLHEDEEGVVYQRAE
jgi:hypothetical protein